MNILKKAFFVSVLTLLPLVVSPIWQTASAAPLTWQGKSEYINSFDSLIELQKNGDLIVTETIKVTTINNSEIRHGIYRDFPTLYSKNGLYSQTGFDLISVKMDGKPVAYHTETVNNGIRLFLGDADIYLDPGIYTYSIQYKTDRQLGFFENHDELYYNITGNGWVFPMVETTAKIVFPELLPVGSVTTDGYTGPYESVKKDFSAEIGTEDNKTTVTYKTTQALSANEGLTVVVTFPKGVFTEPNAAAKMTDFISSNWIIFAGGLALIWSFVSAFLFWFFKGRDPKSGTIIPLYNPPAGLSPAQVRYLYKMEADDKALAAAVIDLAVKGHINLSESKGTYSLINLGKEKNEELSDEENTYHKYIFKGNVKDDFVELEQSSDTTLSRATVAFKTSLNNFNRKNKYIGNLFWLALIVSLLTYALFCLSLIIFPNPVFVGDLGPMLLFSAVFLMPVILIFPPILFKKVKEFFALRRFTTFIALVVLFTSFFIFLTVSLVITFLAISASVSPLANTLVLFFLLFPVLFVGFLSKAMAKRTPTGRKLTDEILGFRMFLETADRERIKQLIPELPLNIRTEKSNIDSSITRLKLFEYYLPFAVALDVEKQWSHHFAEDLAIEPTQDHSYMAWYASSSAWNAAAFASSFSSGLSSSISSASTPPGSSSGSGGGGSSGGGGGGGGGGGW